MMRGLQQLPDGLSCVRVWPGMPCYLQVEPTNTLSACFIINGSSMAVAGWCGAPGNAAQAGATAGKQARHSAFRPWTRRVASAPAAARVPVAPPAPGAAQAPCAAGPGLSYPNSNPDTGAPAAGAQAQPGGPPTGGGAEAGLGSGSEPAGASLEAYVDRTHYCYLFREEGVRRAQGW